MIKNRTMCETSIRNFCLIFAVFIPFVQSQTFKFGQIQWTKCSVGFRDPYFPNVCQNRSDPLSIGVTVNSAWAASLTNDATKMIQTMGDQLAAFRNGTSRRRLSLSRAPNLPQVSRVIGWREGLGDESTVPLTSSGIINCPVEPCSVDSTSPNYLDPSFYYFAIDRELPTYDFRTVYARYSFQITFAKPGAYTIYFKGCCRPDSYEGVHNNYANGFYIRAGVVLNDELVPVAIPASSIRFQMPDEVILRHRGNAYAQETCSAVPTDQLRFQLQAFHPEDAYRSALRFRIGTANEQGRYRCLEWRVDSDGRNRLLVAGGPGDDPTRRICALCPAGGGGAAGDAANSRCGAGRCAEQRAGNDAQEACYWAPPGVAVEDGGVVNVDVSAAGEGTWQLTVAASCHGCYPGLTEEVAVTVDFLVRVIRTVPSDSVLPTDKTINAAAPVAVYGRPGTVPLATRESPLLIQCGRKTFYWPSTASPSYARDSFTVTFRDPDDGRGACGANRGGISYINPSNDLPTGVEWFPKDSLSLPAAPVIGNLTVTWTPRCEDLSNVGLFMFCFHAKDASTLFLVSTASPVDPFPATASAAPTCLFVRSLPPGDGAIPPPKFRVPPTPLDSCNAGCCPCCSMAGTCACRSEGTCCPLLFVSNKKFNWVILWAQDSNDENSVQILIDLPPSVNTSVPGYFLPPPIVSPTRRGCAAGLAACGTQLAHLRGACYASAFQACSDNPAAAEDAAVGVALDLTAQKGYVCASPSGGFTPCDGAATGARKMVISPFMTCYYAAQIPPPQVEVELYRALYGRSPVQDSCKSCVMVRIEEKPFFVDYHPLDAPLGSAPDGSKYQVGLGRSLEINFLVGSSTVGSAASSAILPDPGAPGGTRMGPMRRVEYRGTADNFANHQVLHFTPSQQQLGMIFPICVSAYEPDPTPSASDPRCFTIEVVTSLAVWSLTRPCPWYASGAFGGEPGDGAGDGGARPDSDCPNMGAIRVRAGCTYTYNLSAVASTDHYALTIAPAAAAACPACGPGVPPLAVRPCDAPSADGAAAGTGGTCCGDGVCGGAENGVSCRADCPGDEVSVTSLAVSAVSNNRQARATLRWRPSRGGEGRHTLMCLAAVDTLVGDVVVEPGRAGPMSAAPSVCVAAEILRCEYCVPEGRSLAHVAAHWLRGAAWQALYNVNPGLPDPDSVPAETPVRVGPVYRARPGDSLLSIAAEMHTTLKSLLDFNPDLLPGPSGPAGPAGPTLAAGAPVCVVMCTSPPLPAPDAPAL